MTALISQTITQTTTDKIFIIGLPRTATTSLCVAMLELGFTTAHTAYTYATFEQAQVIADTPIFTDYPILDKLYPNAKFIYLERDLTRWIPSIRQLLSRMLINLNRHDGGFNPYLKRCFKQVFTPTAINDNHPNKNNQSENITDEQIKSDYFLQACYLSHQKSVLNYFKNREKDLLKLNISEANSYLKLITFLGLKDKISAAQINTGFKPINLAGKVTAWNKIKHPLKVESSRNGKIDHIDYLTLAKLNQ